MCKSSGLALTLALTLTVLGMPAASATETKFIHAKAYQQLARECIQEGSSETCKDDDDCCRHDCGEITGLGKRCLNPTQ